MLDKIKYINHQNEVVNFGEDGIVCSINDLRDFSWKYNTLYSKVTTFTKGITKKKIPFVVYGGLELANRIFEVFAKDVIAGKAGKLYIGDYYLQGFFYGTSKVKTSTGLVKGTLEFVTDRAMWVKTSTHIFRPTATISSDGTGFPHGYPYGFGSDANAQKINNTAYIESDFIMTIYGQANSPTLTIDGHSYHVDVNLNAKEFLTINSSDKTIIKTDSKGNKSNMFSSRGIDSYIFQKIPIGESNITASSAFNYDITLLMERSEPEWT